MLILLESNLEIWTNFWKQNSVRVWIEMESRMEDDGK